MIIHMWKCIYVVGINFEFILENVGRTIQLVFQRAESAKVIYIHIVGKNSVIIKNKGYIHYIDCNVTS